MIHKMQTTCVVTILACIPLACGTRNENNDASNSATIQQPMINGTTVTNPETGGFVYITTVTNTATGKPELCSGTLLSNYWILTAKHCIEKTDKDGNRINETVSEGQITLEMGSQKNRQVSYAVALPTVNAGPASHFEKDTAVLRAKDPFVMNGSTTGYIRNLYSEPSSSYNLDIDCFGYGFNVSTGGGYGTGQGTLRTADFHVLDILRRGTVHDTTSIFNNTTFLDEWIWLIENARGQIPSHGDSGGSCLTGITGVNTIMGIIGGGVEKGTPDGNGNPLIYSHAFLTPAYLIRDWVAQQTAPYQFNFTKTCLDVSIDGGGYYSCIGEGPSFGTRNTVHVLTRVSRLWRNYRFKAKAFRGGTLQSEKVTPYRLVSSSGVDKDYYQLDLPNLAPGDWSVEIYVDASDGRGFVLNSTKAFTVKAPYQFAWADTCTKIDGPDGSWNYFCKDPKTVFDKGQTVYGLAKFTDLTYDHRFKLDHYKDDKLIWSFTSDWNRVGTWGWSQTYFPITLAGLDVGSWRVDLSIEADDDRGMQPVTSKNFTVQSPAYKYVSTDICATVDGPDASYNYVCNLHAPARSFKKGETAYGLTKLVEIKKDHRFKVMYYYNGSFLFEGTSSWNRVGTWGWDKVYFTSVLGASADVGKWDLHIYVEADDGKGMQKVDVQSLDITL